MEIRRVWPGDRAGLLQVERLLQREGVSLDRHLDLTLGAYEGEELLATGSFYRNTLRCLAVDSAHQGEGLMAALVSQLTSELFSRGVHDLFVYTKRSAAGSFSSLGFYEIASVDEVVFLENRRDGFLHYLEGLERPASPEGKKVGALVMNANPFTLGHQYLAGAAASASDVLHLFMVSEDVSAFPFAVRQRLIRAGTSHLPGVLYHATGPYLVSSATFPSYFIKESGALTLAQARLDAAVFGRITGALRITDRFVGEEPLSPATALYNQAMAEELPRHGVRLHILPRRSDNGVDPISATRVRALLAEGRLKELQPLVPPSTYDFLGSPEGEEIARRLREARA
ncbi:MAG: [citrate (pro-3S)-lyase] ligase [Christensenellales bacterium]